MENQADKPRKRTRQPRQSNPDKVVLSNSTFHYIIDYLTSRPYGEVAQIMNLIGNELTNDRHV